MGFDAITDYKGIKIKRWERNGKVSYSYSVGIKEGETWLNVSVPLRFKGSPDIPDGTIVHCKDGFETVFSWTKDNKQFTRFGKVITDYDYNGMTEKLKPSFVEMPEPPDYPDSFQAANDDIPF